MRLMRLVVFSTMVVVAASAAAAKPASAGVLTCNDSAERPFAAWGDNSPYALAPNGDLEAGAAGWSLANARVVSGSNTLRGGAYSLQIDSGGSATSPAACVKLFDPASRLFVRNVGAPSGKLKVELRYRTVLGLLPMTTTLGYVSAGSQWQPSQKFSHLLDSVVGTLALNGGIAASVQFRFTAVGSGAAFQIDDLFVDPLLQV